MQVKDYTFTNSDTRTYIVIGDKGYYKENHDCVRVFTTDISKARLLTESQAIATSKLVRGGTYSFVEDVYQ